MIPINKMYCINLHNRNDRMEASKKIFDKYNLFVKFYRVNKDIDDPVRGCFNSHTAIIKKAYEKKFDNVLIFEDDIVCYLDKNEFDNIIQNVYNFIQTHDYDIFFLGSSPDIYNGSAKKITNNIYQVNAFNTHAYILSKSGIEKYKDLAYYNIPIDEIYSKSNKTYAFVPSIFNQNESESDLSKANYFGFKEYLQIFRDKYIIYVNKPIATVIKIIIIGSIILYIVTRNKIFIILPILYLLVCIYRC